MICTQIPRTEGHSGPLTCDPEYDRTLLVVDADPHRPDAIQRLLAEAGCTVLAVRTGEEALALLLERRMPVVLVDGELPDMSGLELCRQIRSRPETARTYFVLVSAQDEVENIVEAFDAGVTDFISRRTQMPELIARLKPAWRLVEMARTFTAEHQALEEAHLELLSLNRKLQIQATTDELTGLTNRRAGLLRLEECFAASYRYDAPLSRLMLDLDHFKRCNDAFGHDAGDAILREVSRVLRLYSRESDIVCRIGGEEFLIICPHTGADAAAELAERLRTEVSRLRVVHRDRELRATISIGVAERSPETASATRLLKHADKALYEAKRSGRNSVSIHEGALARVQPRSSSARVRRARDCTDHYLVLVADDSPSVRRRCRTALEREGCRVLEAKDGIDAYELATRALPDVILLDEVMPTSGIECARLLKSRRRTRDIPILVSQVGAGEEHVSDALAAGVDEFIAKPLHMREMVTRVLQLARAHRNCRRLSRVNRRIRRQEWVLRHLLELFRSAASQRQVSAVTENALDVASRAAGARQVCILLADEYRQRLEVVDSIGLPECAAALHVPVSDDVIGRAFLTARTVTVNYADVQASGPLPGLTAGQVVCMPLVASGQVIGVMLLAGRVPPRPFSRAEMRFIDLICGAAASAIYQIQSQERQNETSSAIVSAMATLTEFRDNETGRHVERVTAFSLLLARELAQQPDFFKEIDEEFLAQLERAVPLHDIGKVAIPDYILLKPGPLEPDEQLKMREHARLGAATIEALIARKVGNGFLVMARDIAWCHHEWYDGSGYPRGLRGDGIPLAARIASVADVYDALTTRRVYKPAQTHARAVEIIREGAGTQFDPRVVQAFLDSQDAFAHAAAILADNVSSETSDSTFR